MATILIVDDDTAFRDSLAETIVSFGHSVEEAASGREAIDVFRAGWLISS